MRYFLPLKKVRNSFIDVATSINYCNDMSIISFITNIAYIPLIFLIMNMVSIGIAYRDKLFLKLIPITLIISIIIGNILLDSNHPNVTFMLS